MAVGLMLFAIAACNTNSSNNQPVTTTTNSGTTTAPPASEVEKRGNALVRVVHVLPAMAAADLFAGETKIFEGVAYKTVTSYKEIPIERQMMRLRLAGQDTAQPLTENSERFGKGDYYTILILADDDSNEAELLFVDDDLAPPASGKARVRVINASYDVGDVDVYAAGRTEPLFSKVAFSSKPTYAEIDPLSGALDVRLAGKNITALTVPAARLDAGKIYTIIIAGRAKGASKLEAITIEDGFGGAATSATNR